MSTQENKIESKPSARKTQYIYNKPNIYSKIKLTEEQTKPIFTIITT